MITGTHLANPESHNEAQMLAGELAKRLGDYFGNVWETSVWENMGWCYRARLGPIDVSERHYVQKDGSVVRKYSCLISHNWDSNGGLGMWTDRDAGPYDTPEAAVIDAFKLVTQVITELYGHAKRVAGALFCKGYEDIRYEVHTEHADTHEEETVYLTHAELCQRYPHVTPWLPPHPEDWFDIDVVADVTRISINRMEVG